MIESLVRRTSEVAAVGVAAAGFIDAAQSTVYYAPNINWRNEPFREKLEARVDMTVIIDNDANAAGWAEFRFGAGRLVSDMVMLTIGTGVGGAIVAGDRLFRGGFGAGAELGHMRVVPDGLPCGCGARGCIEQYGSGRALLRMAERDRRCRRNRPGARRGPRRARRARRSTIVGALIDAGGPGCARRPAPARALARPGLRARSRRVLDPQRLRLRRRRRRGRRAAARARSARPTSSTSRRAATTPSPTS